MPATLTPDVLRELVETGEIDTVLVCFPDLQGRLMGKRVIGHYFVEHLLDGGGAVEACNYLIALDVDMTPLPGYEYANWEQGYGDFRCIPDLGTLRRIPWLEATALVLCDLVDEETGEPVEESPRRILRRQIERAEAMGFRIKIGAELEFFLFENSFRDAAARDYRELTPHSDVIEDYHILQTTRDEYLIRQIRNGIDAAGIPVEFSKGEAGKGQHEINLVYADALEMADRHAIYKNGAKEIASLNGRSITFMAKYSMDEVGSSCHLHSSVWDTTNGDNLMWSDDAPHHLSDVFRGWLAGIVTTGRELAWMFAHYVNSYKRYQPESWAPTALAWGHDNRTCGYRLVGRGPAYRVESRIPGADVNPYLAYAAIIAAGLHGVANAIEPPEPFVGNAYDAPQLPHVPSTLPEAIDLFETSTVVLEAFGPAVHHHLLNTARQEWNTFNRAVTDWERRRNFEQIERRTSDVPAPLIALPAYPMQPGRVDGWADPAVAIQAMYVESLQRAGAQEAVLGPRHLDHGEALAVLERFDGVLLPGGGDVIPERYGASRAAQTYGTIPLRDEFEFALCNAALELARPIFAICRGTQVLNVALGGTLDQHITDDFPGHGTPGVEGGQSVHDVVIEAESRAGAAMGSTRAQCSCHHHQAVDRLGRGLRVTARGDDGVIEALELEGPVWVTAVQWHPEDTAAGDPAQQGLFDAFVAAARR